MDPLANFLAALVASMGSLAALTMAAAGMALMIGLRRWCGRLLLFALFLMVVGTLGPGWLP